MTEESVTRYNLPIKRISPRSSSVGDEEDDIELADYTFEPEVELETDEAVDFISTKMMKRGSKNINQTKAEKTIRLKEKTFQFNMTIFLSSSFQAKENLGHCLEGVFLRGEPSTILIEIPETTIKEEENPKNISESSSESPTLWRIMSGRMIFNSPTFTVANHFKPLYMSR